MYYAVIFPRISYHQLKQRILHGGPTRDINGDKASLNAKDSFLYRVFKIGDTIQLSSAASIIHVTESDRKVLTVALT